MIKSRLDYFESYDDRRQAWQCLHSLSPADRIVVLRHFCDRVADQGHANVRPRRHMAEWAMNAYRSDAWDVRFTNEVYCDIWLLVTQYALDPVKLGNDLDGWARRPWSIPRLRRPAIPAGRANSPTSSSRTGR